MRYALHSRVFLFLAAITVAWTPALGQHEGWPMGGQNFRNTRHQPAETAISSDSVSRLEVKWTATLRGSVTTTPAVHGDAIFVPDWGGYIHRIDRLDGRIVWSRLVGSYVGVECNLQRPNNWERCLISRGTPAVAGDRLVFGDVGGAPWLLDNSVSPPGLGTHIIAISTATGDLIWVTNVESNPAALVTQSPVVHEGVVYVGISSSESALAKYAKDYSCCRFRGSVVALRLSDGGILWRRYTAPAAQGMSGAPVWGGTPVVDVSRGSLYITTGNNYSVPQPVLDCALTAGGDDQKLRDCSERHPDNYFDTLLALDLASEGAVKWSHKTVPFDSFNQSCVPLILPNGVEQWLNRQNCDNPSGPDYDLSQGAALYSVQHLGEQIELLGAGGKSGIYRAVSPDDGTEVWSTQVAPGGKIGGLQWGSAVDATRVYAAASNHGRKPWRLQGTGEYAGRWVWHGFWSALDAATGEILWQTPDPNPDMAQGMVSVANGVVFAGSLAPAPDAHTMFALDAASGEILWRFASGASVNAGPAIVGGEVYWGSGYPNHLMPHTTQNNRLFAFAIK